MARLARPAVTAALAALVVWYLASGLVYLYIHERSAWLLALCVPVLAGLAIARCRRSLVVGGDRWALGLLALPVAVGVLAPARPLGSAAIVSQGPAPPVVRAAAAPLDLGMPLNVAARDLTWDLRLLDRLRSQDPELRGLAGAPVSLVGFVHRTPDLAPDTFLVARFMVRCCTADAVAVSMPVHYDRAADLARDTWVEVEGTVGYEGASDMRTPLVEAHTVRTIPQPTRPYIYP